MKQAFMEEAIRLSREGMRGNAGGPFGAVVVLNDEIIGRGWNQVIASNDPTAHAEVTAIRAATRALGTFRLDDCELYTSCEPCPMCLAAIFWARIRRVFYANTRHDAALIGFDDETFYQQLQTPADQRAVPMTQFLRDSAQPVFAEWQNKPDKIRY